MKHINCVIDVLLTVSIDNIVDICFLVYFRIHADQICKIDSGLVFSLDRRVLNSPSVTVANAANNPFTGIGHSGGQMHHA